jgi:hypothetical protein
LRKKRIEEEAEREQWKNAIKIHFHFHFGKIKFYFYVNIFIRSRDFIVRYCDCVEYFKFYDFFLKNLRSWHFHIFGNNAGAMEIKLRHKTGQKFYAQFSGHFLLSLNIFEYLKISWKFSSLNFEREIIV